MKHWHKHGHLTRHIHINTGYNLRKGANNTTCIRHQTCFQSEVSVQHIYIYITYIADKTPIPISINPIILFLYPRIVNITKQNHNKNPPKKTKLWSEKTNLDLESWDGNIITAIWSGFIERISWNSWISPHHNKLKEFSRTRRKTKEQTQEETRERNNDL